MHLGLVGAPGTELEQFIGGCIFGCGDGVEHQVEHQICSNQGQMRLAGLGKSIWAWSGAS